MNNYEYLLHFREQGMMPVLFSLGVDPSRLGWMEIYAYHIAHPEMSQFDISCHFGISRTMLQRIYRYMESETAPATPNL